MFNKKQMHMTVQGYIVLKFNDIKANILCDIFKYWSNCFPCLETSAETI